MSRYDIYSRFIALRIIRMEIFPVTLFIADFSGDYRGGGVFHLPTENSFIFKLSSLNFVKK